MRALLIFTAVFLFFQSTSYAHACDSKDCSRILFASEQTSGTLSLHSMRPDGSDVKLVVPASVKGRGEYEAAVSPDGKRIAFTTYRYGGWKIAVADIDGSNIRRLTPDPQYVYDPAWSPDNRSIIYRRIVNGSGPYFRGNGALFNINVDSRNNRQLTYTSNEHIRNPAVSHDGQYIIYDAFIGDTLGIMRINSDGLDHQRLTAESVIAFAPSYSPKGELIAHLRQDEDGYIDVWLMNANGANARNITNSRDKGFHAVGDVFQHWQFETSVSPDGTMIAFTADYSEKGNADIYVVSVESGAVQRLTTSKGADLHPFWYKVTDD